MFNVNELNWIACALEAMKAEHEEWKEEKKVLGIENAQDIADIAMLEALLKKVQSLANKKCERRKRLRRKNESLAVLKGGFPA